MQSYHALLYRLTDETRPHLTGFGCAALTPLSSLPVRQRIACVMGRQERPSQEIRREMGQLSEAKGEEYYTLVQQIGNTHLPFSALERLAYGMGENDHVPDTWYLVQPEPKARMSKLATITSTINDTHKGWKRSPATSAELQEFLANYETARKQGRINWGGMVQIGRGTFIC